MKDHLRSNAIWAASASLAVLATVLLIGLPGNEPFWPACANIHPCNPDGTVMDNFNSGACAEFYERECARDILDKVTLSEQINKCELEKAALSARLDSAAKKIKRLQVVKRTKRVSR